MEENQVMADLRARLAAALGSAEYDAWFGQQTQLRLGDRVLNVAAATMFTRDWLARNFATHVREACRHILGENWRVDFTVAVDGAPVAVALSTLAPPAPCAAASQPAQLGLAPAQLTLVTEEGAQARPALPANTARPEPRLANLVVGASNEYAVRSAEVTARGLQQASPVLFCGPTGVGKTHLLRAIKAEHRRVSPRSRVVYLTAEQFITSFVDALRSTGLPSFRQKCRGADLLIIDDLQFFAGKRASLDELLHTIDALLAEGRQLVFAADRSLAELQPLGRELVSRLASGLTCTLQLPDYAMRCEIVRLQARELTLTLDAEVVGVVATQITASARELRGALFRLQAASFADQQPITASSALAALADLAQQSSRSVRLADVEQAICDVFGVEAAALRSERKSRSIQEPRMLAMWLARKYTRAPWSEIGEFFGRRSHSTVISAHRRVEQLIRTRAEIGLSHRSCGVEEAIRRVEMALRTA